MIAPNILQVVVIAAVLLAVIVEKYIERKKKLDFNTKNEALNKELQERLPHDDSEGRRLFFELIRAANENGISTKKIIKIMNEATRRK